MTLAQQFRLEGFIEGFIESFREAYNQGLQEESPHYQEALQRGEILAQQGAIIGVLKIRFAPIPAELRQRIRTISAPNQLRELLPLTIQSASLAEFADHLSSH